MPEPLPVDMRIAFAKAVIDSERLVRDTYRRDSFDGGKEWKRNQARLDARLEDLWLMVLERDGIKIPDALEAELA
jgi:hypothetical protein